MSATPLYSQEIINIGAAPNDQTGDPLRTAFAKINNNFSNLFQTFVNSTLSYSFGNTPGQVVFEVPADTFTKGKFYIKTINGGTANSQSVELFAQINNDQDDIKFTGYGSTFFGDPLTNYNMVVDSTSGNVQILVNPLVSDDMTHFISSQIMWAGPNVVGLYLEADGYGNAYLSTENDTPIIAEQPQ